MATELDDRIDALYGLSLDRFTAERDALAKELRAAGEAGDAATVKALRKPVVSAWALNLLARQDAAGIGELLEIGGRLREAHRRAISGGDVDGLREATDERRRIVAELTGKALAIAEPGGGPSSALEVAVASTLEAASVDAEAGGLLRSGRLTKPLRPPAELPDAGLRVVEGGRQAPKAAPDRERPAEIASLERELRGAEARERRATEAVARETARVEDLERRRAEGRERLRAAEAELRGATMETKRIAARLAKLR
jgi:hypothetical protein